MAERDFEAEFSRMVAGTLATEDPELLDRYRTEIYGSEQVRAEAAPVEGVVQKVAVENWVLPQHQNLMGGGCIKAILGLKKRKGYFR